MFYMIVHSLAVNQYVVKIHNDKNYQIVSKKFIHEVRKCCRCID